MLSLQVSRLCSAIASFIFHVEPLHFGSSNCSIGCYVSSGSWGYSSNALSRALFTGNLDFWCVFPHNRFFRTDSITPRSWISRFRPNLSSIHTFAMSNAVFRYRIVDHMRPNKNWKTLLQKQKQNTKSRADLLLVGWVGTEKLVIPVAIRGLLMGSLDADEEDDTLLVTAI